MSIKGMLFSTEMVRAILDGRKTVTRRVVKPQPIYSANSGFNWKGHAFGTDLPPTVNGAAYNFRCAAPYNPGDILYVRETWKVQSARRFEADARIMFKAGGPMTTIQFPGRKSQATSREGYDSFVAKWMQGDGWHPSIYMPREAARIFLRVTDVRVERLQEMTEDDVVAEGAEPLIQCHNEHPVWDENGVMYGMCWNEDCCGSHCDYIEKSYGELFGELVWDSTIKPADRERYGWAANPWVWVIAFERCEKPKEG